MAKHDFKPHRAVAAYSKKFIVLAAAVLKKALSLKHFDRGAEIGCSLSSRNNVPAHADLPFGSLLERIRSAQVGRRVLLRHIVQMP